MPKRYIRKRCRNIRTLPAQMKKTLYNIPRLDSSYMPARAELFDGRIEPCVVFVELNVAKKQLDGFSGPLVIGNGKKSIDFFSLFGVFYSHDNRTMIDLENVVSIYPSEFRLPLAVERKMEDHGQTHHSGWVVKFILKDGLGFWQSFSLERAWFASVPPGYSAEDIVDVIFPPVDEYKGLWDREEIVEAPSFKYCVFATE